MKKRKRKPKKSLLSRIWQRIIRNTSSRGCQIGIPDRQIKRRDR